MMKFSQKSPSSNYNLKTSKKRENTIEEFDVFGKDLKMLIELSHSKEIPDLIFIFGYFIKNYGLLVQGIFRVSGNKTRMEEIKSNYVQKKLIEINIDDIHNITGLYKMFLREIPGGLIPYSQAIDLIKATKIHKKNENIDLITTELLKLPVPNYNLLKYTSSLLSHVCKCCGSNLMNSDNLGTVFGPTFFSSIEDISLLSIANITTTVLIVNYNELFKVSAPVHTNLKHTNNNNNKYGSLTTTSINGNGSKCSNDQNVTIKFGDSYLSINMSADIDNSFLSNSFQDEEPISFSDRQDASLVNNSCNGNPQFSNSLALALKMCVNNHLFDQFEEQEFSNGDFFPPTSLISNNMLNGYYPDPRYQRISEPISYPLHYNSNDRNISFINDKKRDFEDNPKFSLPRRTSQPNPQQTYMNSYEFNTKNQELINRPDTFSSLTRYPHHTDVHNDNRPLSYVPQLDLSTLMEPCEPEDSKSHFKTNIPDFNKQTNVNIRQQKSNNTHQTIHENKVIEPETNLNQLQRKISSLKNQLRQFESSYLASNGVKPDKSVKLSNEWYQKTLNDLKVLRQDKEQFVNSLDKTKETECDSVKSIKKKFMTGSGDCTDHKYNYSVTPVDNRSLHSRPVSVLSESAVKIGINNESARSNTLNSVAITTSIVEDLSPRECDQLKLTLDQISFHLKEERIRDKRPEDLDLMTNEQIECEKVTMQKALLNFECKYGRRKNPNAIQLMRPLYDRYRQVKKRLALNIESFGYDPKTAVQRTLDNRGKSNLYQSAWTSEKPLSNNLESNNYFSIPQTTNLDVIMPSNIQFDNSDIGDDSTSVDPNNKPDSNQRLSNHSNKRNSNTFQYRKKPIPSDLNNNNNILINSKLNTDDFKSEFQKLVKDKKELQRILKDFENNFEKETKRKVEKSDRLPMEREYARYKMIKNRIKELEESFDSSMS